MSEPGIYLLICSKTSWWAARLEGWRAVCREYITSRESPPLLSLSPRSAIILSVRVIYTNQAAPAPPQPPTITTSNENFKPFSLLDSLHGRMADVLPFIPSSCQKFNIVAFPVLCVSKYSFIISGHRNIGQATGELTASYSKPGGAWSISVLVPVCPANLPCLLAS